MTITDGTAAGENMSIQELDKTYVANTYKRFPIVVESGKGSVVVDDAGTEYIDLGAGIAVTSFGIADEEWQAAITEQMSKVQHISNLYYTEPGVKLAQILCERTGFKKVFFSNSGAEANECAFKVARKYASDKYGAGRHTIVTLNDSFHGRTLSTLAATGQDSFHELFQPLTPGFVSIDPSVAELRSVHETTPVAGVLIELIQGEGGVNVIDPAFVSELAEYCKSEDIVLMLDEVQTGNGRLGTLFGYEKYGIEPDVVTTAKGLAGGLPLGATLMGEKVQNVLGYGEHGSTFGANPVCCAAAINIVNRIDDSLLAEVTAKGNYLMSELAAMDGVEEVSGMGLMIGFKASKPAADVVSECMANGVLALTAKDKVRLLPALNIPQELLAQAVDVIRAVVAPAGN